MCAKENKIMMTDFYLKINIIDSTCICKFIMLRKNYKIYIKQ